MNIDENRERKEECQRKRNVNGLPASLFLSSFCKYLEKGEKRGSSKSYVNQVHAEQYFEIKRRIIPNYPTFCGKTLKLQLCILFEIL